MDNLYIDPVAAFFMFTYGFILIFAGKTVIKLMVGVGFGAFLGAVGFVIASIISGPGGGLIVFLLMFIIGVVVGWWIFKASLSFLSGITVWYLLTSLMGIAKFSSISILILMVIIILAYMLIEHAITGVAILVGATLVYVSLESWIGAIPSLIATGFLVMFRIVWLFESKGVI
ncbi:MAG: hypothetical protein QXP68_01295 [Thermosphaera sp.]